MRIYFTRLLAKSMYKWNVWFIVAGATRQLWFVINHTEYIISVQGFCAHHFQTKSYNETHQIKQCTKCKSCKTVPEYQFEGLHLPSPHYRKAKSK